MLNSIVYKNTGIMQTDCTHLYIMQYSAKFDMLKWKTSNIFLSQNLRILLKYICLKNSIKLQEN